MKKLLLLTLFITASSVHYFSIPQEIPALTLLAEGEWKCRKCGRYNWAQNPPYVCNSCGCAIGEC